MELFPYEFRPKQAELVRFIDSAVRDGCPAVIEAGTGIGKTVSALCGTLPLVLEKGTKVLYLTRTKSQQKQVVREVAAIGHGVLCVPMQGRSSYSCPMMRDDPETAAGTPEELSRLCSEYKRRDKDGHYRELHTKEAAESINYEVKDDYRIHYEAKKNEGVQVMSCHQFTTAVYDIDEPMTIDYSDLDSFVILIGVDGEGTITDEEGHTTSLRAGETVLLPAIAQEITVNGTVKFLESFV